ncbi:hypothetical protein CspeluHIS016_0803090 [Cutaneotrichosporon spelunceum]|uniref:NADPH-dependent FMN reductase-like domain-containing protein n=1 Tax=Cutaneotrichosporon spelunceum TaxID=1672016 RepID=A0AAD3TZN0_9TREE|nr:hypothetical protein CspeluHIS016_0803090 [Cutaneotrichosporon spelunceum]
MARLQRAALLTALVVLLALAYHYHLSQPHQPATTTLGVVLGTERRGGNTIGIGTYLRTFTPALSRLGVAVDVVDLTSLNLPRTFVHVPSKPRAPSVWSYLPSSDKAWASRVRGWDAVLFIAPEYNGHVPGLLKSALDRLYHEWRGMPAGLVAHGHEGGRKVLETGMALLRELGMDVVGGVAVSTGGRPVEGSEAWLEIEVGAQMEELLLALVTSAGAAAEQRIRAG